MNNDADLQSLSVDLAGLQAVVRALARTQAWRSPTALGDLLQALSTEADRLGEACDVSGATSDHGAHAVVQAWIEHIKEEALLA